MEHCLITRLRLHMANPCTKFEVSSISRCGDISHTHTRLTALCPGLTGWAGTRKVKTKPMWILLKQETVSGSGISWTTCKAAPRSRQITMPASHLSVFTGWMPFLPPNQQCQSTEGTGTEEGRTECLKQYTASYDIWSYCYCYKWPSCNTVAADLAKDAAEEVVMAGKVVDEQPCLRVGIEQLVSRAAEEAAVWVKRGLDQLWHELTEDATAVNAGLIDTSEVHQSNLHPQLQVRLCKSPTHSQHSEQTVTTNPNTLHLPSDESVVQFTRYGSDIFQVWQKRSVMITFCFILHITDMAAALRTNYH